MPTLTLLDDAMLRAGRMVPAVGRLGGGTIAMAGSQQPWRVVGSEAVVYQLRQPSGRVLALRCLLSDTPDSALADRYRALGLDTTLRSLRAGGSSPIVGQINYIAEGLELPGSQLRSVHHPVIGMDWVMGPTLMAATDRASRARDTAYLAALAQAWRGAVESLRGVSFVHGNLSGDNAMVRPREGIALVDYDTAYWPGAPRITQLDPRPGYRHPKGIPTDPERRDEFAALVIYTSLRILANWPDLRDEHGDPASQLGGALLFSARDLQNPDGSSLFGKLRVMDDRELQALVASLREWCRTKVDDGPTFAEVVRGAAMVARVPGQSPGGPGRTQPLHDAAKERLQKIHRLNGFLLAGDDEGAHHFWRTSGLMDDHEAAREYGPRLLEIDRRRAMKATRAAAEQADHLRVVQTWETANVDAEPVAAPLRPVVDRSRRRNESLERLRQALERGDAGAVGQIWPEVRTDSGASAYAAQANEIISKLMGAAIAGAIERGDDRAVVTTVAEAERNGYAIGTAARRAARLATARLDSSSRLERALIDDDRMALGDMALSGELDLMGDFDAPTTRQIMRALATPHLLRAVSNGDDFAIEDAYEEDVFGGYGGVPADVVDRVALAVERVRWLKAVRLALRGRDTATLIVAMNNIPDQADRRLSTAERTRIDRMIKQHAAVDRLDAAISSGQDMAIVDALNDLEAAGALLPESLDWEAIRGVIDRLSLVASIRRAASVEPLDHSRLARLLRQARDEADGSAPYLGGGLDFESLELEVSRAAHRARVRDALRTNDDRAIVSATLPDLYGAVPTLEPAEQERVQQAIAKHRGTGPLGRTPMAGAGPGN